MELSGARCLDGSPPVYYIQQNSEKNKWFIFHEGGGLCKSTEDCYVRSKQRLGSTTQDPDTIQKTDAYFSINQTINPMMYNWNKVYIRYCDGALHSGMI